MQFTSAVEWSPADFLVMGGILLMAGFALDFALRHMGAYRFLGALVVIVLLLWLWAELAVGVFTNLGS